MAILWLSEQRVGVVQNMIIRIAVFSPLRRLFDYHCHQPVCVGARVMVPFGPRRVVGIVTAIDCQAAIEVGKIKTINRVLDQAPIVDAELFFLCHWASDYYHYALGQVFSTALPKKLRENKINRTPDSIQWQLTALGQQAEINEKKAKKQYQAWTQLKTNPCTMPVLLAHQISRATLKAMEKKGWVQSCVIKAPSVLLEKKKTIKPEKKIVLNEEQKIAVDTVVASLNVFQAFLLDGITGSGKTEVYMHIVQQALAQNQQALIVVPEIGLTPQLIERFHQRFGDICMAMHSKLNDSERLDVWWAAKENRAKIIIGTRSSIFIPAPFLGVIIIDEEHDLSFKQQEGLRYSARDLAVVRAKHKNIPLVLGSATPSLESLHNVNKKRYHYLRLSQRAGGAKEPTFKLIDMRGKTPQHGLSEKLILRIRETLEKKQQVLLFLNRRGFSPVLMCYRCGWSAKCPHCDFNMTYHKKAQQLSCHHCEISRPVFACCPACGADAIHPVGVGTQRLEEALNQLFPDVAIVRMDRDTTRRKNALSEKLEIIHQGGAQILVGTQMLAKGHHFPRVTLVGIINVDNGLMSSDFRALERTGQLLLQVAGRAGRAALPGTVMIQTLQPDNPHLRGLLKQDYLTFANKLLKERALTHMPPFSFFTLVRADAAKEGPAYTFLQAVKDIAKPFEGITVMGPVAAPMAKRAQRFRVQLLFCSNNRSMLQQSLKIIVEKIATIKLRHRVRWSIDVDPQEMF
jgi:primosomal protein N' (replication factor Y) (superfamily II helicase)